MAAGTVRRRTRDWMRTWSQEMHVCGSDALCLDGCFDELDTAHWPLDLRVYMQWWPRRDRLFGDWCWLAPETLRTVGTQVVFAHMYLGMGTSRFVCWDEVRRRWSVQVRRDLAALPPGTPEPAPAEVQTLHECLAWLRRFGTSTSTTTPHLCC